MTLTPVRIRTARPAVKLLHESNARDRAAPRQLPGYVVDVDFNAHRNSNFTVAVQQMFKFPPDPEWPAITDGPMRPQAPRVPGPALPLIRTNYLEPPPPSPSDPPVPRSDINPLEGPTPRWVIFISWREAARCSERSSGTWGRWDCP